MPSSLAPYPTRWLALCTLIGVLWSKDLTDLRASEQPNVIVILTDDQGWGDVSLHGNANLSTPNIDHLARSGVQFERFYVCPVCAPTRAEFLTGRYHPRGGVRGVTMGQERLDPNERTIAEVFQQAGYSTAAFGKWHNGTQPPYHPLNRGFEEFYGYTAGHWGHYFSPPQLDHNGRLTRGQGYLVEDFTTHALDFIEAHRNQPFFVYLPLPTPHSPMQVPDRFWHSAQDRELELRAVEADSEDLDFTRAALAMVECIDFHIGRILAKLDDLELTENTVVVFFCDNGPNSHRWNGGMKGKKGSTDEGGVRSPLFVAWPGQIPAGSRVTEISGCIDLLPTLAELAGIDLADTPALDGQSLVPLIHGQTPTSSSRSIFSHWNGRVSVRTQRFRLDHRGQLFDMWHDPGQTQPVNSQFPAETRRLKQQVQTFRDDLLDGFERDTRPFPIGYSDRQVTQLPARDGSGEGDIARSASAPNCSYFTQWTSTQDTIRWPVEVLSAGNYAVDMLYACPASSVGTVVELQLGNQVLRAPIQVAHDPVAEGLEHDRVPRVTQSPMKEFASMRLGTVSLATGEGELRLRASRIVGDGPLEMRMLLFRRTE